MNTNYPAPPCSSETIDVNQQQPHHAFVRDNDVKKKLAMEAAGSLQAPHYQPVYALPPSIVYGNSFGDLKQSFNSCMLLEAPAHHICSTDAIDRVYYGTVNGDVILLPLNGSVPPAKFVLNPTTLRVPNESPLKVFEVHGLKLDYAGRVWATNAAGLFVFDALLRQNLFFMPDDRPDLEKADNYMEDIRRLATDYNRRTVFWLMAGCIIRSIDSATCKAVCPDYQFNHRSALAVRVWSVSLDGRFLYVLYDTRSQRSGCCRTSRSS
jgi:hypothetical protein